MSFWLILVVAISLMEPLCWMSGVRIDLFIRFPLCSRLSCVLHCMKYSMKDSNNSWIACRDSRLLLVFISSGLLQVLLDILL